MEDASTTTLLDKEQAAFIESVKQEIRTAQHRALRQVNQEMILLYWKIGKMLNEHVAYGNQFIDQLARELRFSFPDMKGLSARNLRYMKRFARKMKTNEFCKQCLQNYHGVIIFVCSIR